MTSVRASTVAVEGLVFDFLVSACDTILQERRGLCNPSALKFTDNLDFCKTTLQPWKKDLSRPLVLDLYILDPKMNKHVLMERWKFFYQRANDLKDTNNLALINRYNLVNISPKSPTINFQLYEQRGPYPTNFVSDALPYRFEQVSTSKGLIVASVKYMTQHCLKDILIAINGGAALAGLPSSGHSRRNSRTVEDTNTSSTTGACSAAIPIPCTDAAAAASRDRERELHNGKHMNARMVTHTATSLDAAAENSSPSSIGTHTSDRLPNAGSTPPLPRYSAASRCTSRDTHRRSFQLASHAEYQPDAEHAHSYEDASEAVRMLQQQHQYLNQRAQQQAASLDSNASSASQMQYLQQQQQASSAGGGGSRPSSFRLTPSGIPAAPSTSYGNSYSHASTPPFSLGELAAQQSERYSGSYPELTQESLPYPSFSSSLTSTSPHFGANMLALIEQRQTGQNQEQPAYGKGNPNETQSFVFANALKSGRVSPKSALDFKDLKLRIHPLPSSPFIRSGAGPYSDDGTESTDDLMHGRSKALVPSRQSTPKANSASPKAASAGVATGASGASRLSGAVQGLGGGGSMSGVGEHCGGEEDNTLEAARLLESQRYSLENADSMDMYAFRSSFDNNSGSRQLSKERSSDGTDADLRYLDEELPFAWGESDMSLGAVAVSPRMGDSVGAQLVYGMSKMNFSGERSGAGGVGGFGYGQHTGGNNSSYTGAGLSGELLGKINEYKNFNYS